MIYFDNAATTQVSQNAANAAYDMLVNNYGNPSSPHSAGFKAEQKINSAKEEIAAALKVKPYEIFFTSGGTESNNLAILGCAECYKRTANKIITLNTEHPSVKQTFEELSKRGFEVVFADIDKKGYVDKQKLMELIDSNTLMVSIMHINNEFGTIQDIEEIAKAVKSKNKNVIFHTDGVQGFGKHKINLKNIDLYSFSAHKIHAPKGIGGLYIKNGIRLKSIMFGGEQQNKIRPGTENTAGIAALCAACRDSFDNIDKNFDNVSKIKSCLIDITNDIDDVYVNGDVEKGSPYILSLDFKSIKGEVLVHALEKKEIYVSTGSACSTKSNKKTAVYYINPDSEGTIRFSFSSLNSIEQAEECKNALKEIVPKLRIYKSKNVIRR